MTIETKTTIHASDIATVEFECAHCHTVTSFPLSVAKAPPTRCLCNPSENWMALGGQEFTAIAELLSLLQQFAKAPNKPFIMRFGLRPSGS